MARFQETKARDDQRAAADLAGSPLDSSDMDMLAEARVPKARKPYMITKQREKWTEDEHNLFLEALQLHGRSWSRIQEHIGTKTAVQIRSHAQKFFTKVIRESSGDNSNGSGAASPIQIPPPRPKRKSVHPYPCNMRKASGKHVHALPQLEKPQLQMQSLCEQENGSPRSELTTSYMDSETFGSDDSDRSPASTIEVEERCPTPSMATAELAEQVPPTNVKEAKGDTTSKEVGCDRSEVPVLKLFGKRVVVNDSHQQPKSDSYNLQTVADMELDASAETPTSGTANFSSHGTAEANTWSPWPTNMQQFMYYLPPGALFFSYNDGSMPCHVSSNSIAAASNQQHHHQHPEAEAESNTASCSVPETTAQNSEYAESYTQANDNKDKRVPVSGLRKSLSQTSTCQRGFMPYKRCAAESKARQSLVPGEEADGEMTRLCL